MITKINNKIEKVVKLYPNYKIFLATDELKAREMLTQKFKDKIITQKIKLSSTNKFNSEIRNTEIGIINSVVDLFCLSYCNILVGFDASSFFRMAINMSNTDKIFYI